MAVETIVGPRSRLRWEPTALVAIGVYAAAWLVFALASRYPGYVHFDTGEIVMWSHAGLQLGYLKHPPFLPWLVWLLDHVAPLNEVTLALLSVASMTLGAYAVWRIALMTIGQARAPIAMLLYLLCPFFTWQAVKLNHNSILVSLWPLIVWAFLLSLREPTIKRGVILGVIAAIGVLAKYSTMMLIGAAFLAAVVSPRRREYFTSPAPYAGAAVAVLMLIPHVAWVMAANTDSVVHAFRVAATDQKFAERFLGTNLLNLLPMLVAVPILRLAMGRNRTAEEAKPFDGWIELWVITIVPYLIMCTLIPVLGMRASQSWSMPVFAMLAILLAQQLTTPDSAQTNRVYKMGYAGALGLVLAGPVILSMSFKREEPAVVEPRIEIALAAHELWLEVAQRPVPVVAGEHAIITSMWGRPFGRPLMWTTFVADVMTPWLTRDQVRARGVLAVCLHDKPSCLARAGAALAERGGVRCEVQRSRSLAGRMAPAVTADVFIIAPAGETLAAPKSRFCTAVAAEVKP